MAQLRIPALYMRGGTQARDLVRSPELNIVTIEDPVEYQLDLINQTHVNDQIGLSFAKILRAMLRQAPNIILVGEIRDGETAEIDCVTGQLPGDIYAAGRLGIYRLARDPRLPVDILKQIHAIPEVQSITLAGTTLYAAVEVRGKD